MRMRAKLKQLRARFRGWVSLVFARKFLKVWIALMSGGVSVAFSFWAAYKEPSNTTLKYGLWVTAGICVVYSCYQLWAEEHKEARYWREVADEKANQVTREFQELRLRILTCRVDPLIGQHLLALRDFLFSHHHLLTRSDVLGFYKAWIAPKESALDIAVTLGRPVSLGLTQNEWEQMREQLSRIDLRTAMTTLENQQEAMELPSRKTITIVPDPQQSWWCKATEGNLPAMQVLGSFYITNLTDGEIRILRALIPSTNTAAKMLTAKNQITNEAAFNTVSIEPQATAKVETMFFVTSQQHDPAQDFTTTIVFIDQFGDEHEAAGVMFRHLPN